MTLALGINTCFAVKRWPQAAEWAPIVAHELGLEVVQHSLDLVDLTAPDDALRAEADAVRAACDRTGMTVHSTFTGLVAYSSNLLLDPDPGARARAEAWYERVIWFTSLLGAKVAGGHVGSLSRAEYADPDRRTERWEGLRRALDRLAAVAHRRGLRSLLVENMACAREPSTMASVAELLSDGDAEHVPVSLCLDVGHQCVPGTSGDERDPYAWLRRLAARSDVIHLQQSDAEADHHWPFTTEHNAKGRIRADRVVRAIGDARPTLVLEVIPTFEADDEQVLADLRQSVTYWRRALGVTDGD